MPKLNLASINPISASAAAFISDTDYNDALNIDESQITVTTKAYKNAGKQIPHNVNEYLNDDKKTEKKIECNSKIVVSLFERATITVNVSGSAISSRGVNTINNMELTVTYYIDGGSNHVTYKPSKVSQLSDTSYNVEYEVITRGDSFTYSTSNVIYGISNVSCNYAAYAGHGSGYKRVDVKTPGGENLIICTRNDSRISTSELKAWAKRLCMLSNSLSQMTGVKLDNVYILFDDTEGEYGYSANWYIKDGAPDNGYIAFNKDATTEILNSVSTGKNEMVWCLMHELAHSYAIHTDPSTFYENYGMLRNNIYFDEFVTNMRALTAIQNCDNLRSMNINYTDKNIVGKYDKIFKLINPPVSDPIFNYALKLSNIANTYGWDKLEKYFAATSDYSYDSPENISAAAAINEICGTSISTSNNDDFLKFVNSLRKIYKLSWSHTTFDKNSFKEFVKQWFGKDCIVNSLKVLGF
ncbi:MAG: hypothetical protein IKK91_09290 [Ruminococcus sp.]|nr:hypothetical protein [Ruminococcus sp.]